MEGYRYQQLAYLIIPIIAGSEFFRCARSARKSTGKESKSAVTMDAFGYVFMVFIPAIFAFTIFSLEYQRFPLLTHVLHRFDRYAVMFLFLGSWWQIFLITWLKARRTSDTGRPMFFPVWFPYLLLGLYISALILWSAPFYLMWVSIVWFAGSFCFMAAVGAATRKVGKFFLILAVVVFIGENIFFVILDAIV